ncbi:MAG: peptide ABC transporter substrate-binding protein [Candidatus Eremiobacteraeota bacterium]|nr:peptide ABC transporter substrate-binding protein [Candidatus Eremiobacteraeota bacterium]
MSPWRLALVAFGLAVLASCGRAPGTSVPTVRFDVASDPANLNPLFAHADAGNVDQTLAHLAFEPFFDLDASGTAVPELVTAVPSTANGGISADGRTITYHLRHVAWSDGVAVTAGDVLYTLRAILDPANPVASHEGYDLIDRADSPDAHTVRFHLSRPWAPAVSTFFTYGTSPQYVLPQHVLAAQGPLFRAAFNAAPTVGDGPFTFVSWHRGDRIVYAANPRYWRGAPKVKRLDVRIVPDPQTNMTLLQSGSLDFNLVAPAQWAALRRTTPALHAAFAPTALVAGIALEQEHPPLDDPLVRTAIAQSIDREAISNKITLGRYPVANSDRPRFSWAYDPHVVEPGYDPVSADRAFDRAGWKRARSGMRAKNGKPFALTYVQFPETNTGVRVAEVVQRELFERGIDVTIKAVSNALLFLPARQGGELAAGRFDLAYVPWTMGADPDDRALLSCTGATKNYMRFCDPLVDKFEEQAVADPSQAERKAFYGLVDSIVAHDVPIVYLFNPTYIYAYSPRLTGFAPNAFVPTWNAYAWSVQ